MWTLITRVRSNSKLVMNETGSVLAVAVLILAFLTLIGLAVGTTSQIEIQLAGNEKFHRTAFYNADSGAYSGPKLIRRCLDSGSEPVYGGITYLEAGTDLFLGELMGFDAYDSQPDFRLNIAGFVVDVDVKRTKQVLISGGGVEFAAGSEGIGTGSAGGVAIIYTVDSKGQGPGQSRAVIQTEYRYVPGVAGGL